MTEETEQTLSWIGLISVPGVGRATFRKLVAAFGSPRAALAAPASDLREIGGISERLATTIKAHAWREPAERELMRARAALVTIVTLDDRRYPAALASTPDPPVFLYVRGNVASCDKQAVAIVGTRTPTHLGVSVTFRMAYDLAEAGFTVVSGLARGIDTQAHKGALAARGGTIAVLGCGIDVVYPPENRELLERIAESGAVISENPFGTQPESGYFPARNRIISGLSRGTVIVEAAEDSGSLITADYTVKQGRMLFAVPGSVASPTSRGTNSLIKRGAVLVESSDDVLGKLDDAGLRQSPRRKAEKLYPPMTATEQAVFDALGPDPVHIDRLMTLCNTKPGPLSGLLTTMELKGLVKQLPGKYFVRD